MLIGSDADLTMMKGLGVETELGKAGEVPVYDPETFETNVPGVFVADILRINVISKVRSMRQNYWFPNSPGRSKNDLHFPL